MKVQCPRCSTQVPVANISLDTGWGKCEVCQELFPLAEVVPGLLPVGWNARHPSLAALGVRRMTPGDVVEALGGLEREPVWWRAVYGALE